jgi:hypothetical protein
MKLSELYLLGTMIFIAPHLSQKNGRAASLACAVLALVIAVVEPFVRAYFRYHP